MNVRTVQTSREVPVYDILESVPSFPCVVLESGWGGEGDRSSFIFSECFGRLILDNPQRVDVFSRKMRDYLDAGYWLAGFFSYEFGYCLEERLFPLMPRRRNLPLAWMGIFGAPAVMGARERVHCPSDKVNPAPRIRGLHAGISKQEYVQAIRDIKRYIGEGDTYQVNFTFPVFFEVEGGIIQLYRTLLKAQPTPYAAFIWTGTDYVLSFSPELFFSLKGRRITTRPMKGTSPRGRLSDEDRHRAYALRRSRKNRAENLMIVDLLRNDLGRISKPGTVEVKELFTLERYSTLWQMTSTITASLTRNVGTEDIFRALFPCGSVTGAPKIRTMQIIREMEKHPRGVYCGAIGYISPYGEMCFNVAIRTLHITRRGEGTLGVGGGIVYDSRPDKEFKEAFLKAKFFIKPQPVFMLVETMRATKQEGFYLLDLHLRRLRRSCAYFGIDVDMDKVKNELKRLREELSDDKVYRVRLLISLEGNISLEPGVLDAMETPLRVKIVKTNLSSNDVYLYHKTTYRPFYNRKIEDARRQGFHEVVFVNKDGEVTEGTFTNVFIRTAGRMYTPPVKCGLLPGVLRAHLIRTRQVEERLIYPEEIVRADKVFVGNSVRGLMEAEVEPAYQWQIA